MVVLFYTIYFPFLLKILAQQHHPRVDPFNEVGEKRTESDQEYNRLMDYDRSPYNFAYNVQYGEISLTKGYKLRWVSFKVYILVTRVVYG